MAKNAKLSSTYSGCSLVIVDIYWSLTIAYKKG